MENSGVFRARISRLTRIPSSLVTTALILTSLVVLLITGFWTSLQKYQSLPLYLYLVLLLLTLQGAALTTQRMRDRLFLIVSSLLAAVYISIITYGPKIFSVVKNPLTYVVVNSAFIAIFLIDAVVRMRDRLRLPLPQIAVDSPEVRADTQARIRTIRIAGAIAADGVGLAVVLFFIEQGLVFLQSASQQDSFFSSLLIHPARNCPSSALTDVQGNICVPILSKDPAIRSMAAFDTVLVSVGIALTLFSLALVGAQIVRRNQPGGEDVRRYLGSLGDILGGSLEQLRLSAKRVGVPVVWLIPSYFIAALSQRIVAYYNTNASYPNVSTSQIFFQINLSSPSISSIAEGILISALALVGTLLAIVIYADREVFRLAWGSLRLAGRILAFCVFPIIFGLAAINVAAIAALPFKVTAPFQVGLLGWLTVVVFVLYIGLNLFLGRTTRRTDGKSPDQIPLS
jgi:hypothetical protein